MSSKPLIGILFKILSALIFTIMSALLKSVSSRYPAGEMMFFRSAFALIPLLIWMASTDSFINSVRTKNIKGHFFRSFLGSASMMATFSALSYLPLQDAIALGYTSPLVLVIFAAIFLKEKVRIYRWSAVIVGLFGVLIMLAPHLSVFSDHSISGQNTAIGALFAVTGAVIAAGAGIQIRHLTKFERTGAIVFYFSSFSAMIALLSWPLGYLGGANYHWHIPNLHDFLVFVAAGCFGGVAQILLTSALARADASIIAPFEYTSMIWALLLGYFVFGDAPTTTILIGGVIVASTGIFIVWREHQLGLIRRADAEAAARNPHTQ